MWEVDWTLQDLGLRVWGLLAGVGHEAISLHKPLLGGRWGRFGFGEGVQGLGFGGFLNPKP